MLDGNVSDRVNYKGISTRENGGLTKVLTEGIEAGL